MAVCQNLVPLPLKMVLIGIDPYPYQAHQHYGQLLMSCPTRKNACFFVYHSLEIIMAISHAFLIWAFLTIGGSQVTIS